MGGVVHDADTASAANQRRMNADPFEMFLMNVGASAEGLPDVRPSAVWRTRPSSDDEEEDGDEHGPPDIQCRTS